MNLANVDIVGFSLTRLRDTPDMQGSKEISGNLTILSFMMGDGGLTFGCGQNYYLSGSSCLNTTVNITLELQFAGMLCYYSNLLFKDLLN